MRGFWNIFQPGEKPRAAEKEENARGAPTGAPTTPPQPRAPAFKRYPPADREWAFAADVDGRHLDSLWRSVKDGEGRQPIITNRPAFLPFVTALTHACELAAATTTAHARSVDDATDGYPNSSPVVGARRSGQGGRQGDAPAALDPVAAAVVVTPTFTADARGVPPGIVGGLAEAVLSAAVCRCGREISSSLSVGGGCVNHGLAAISWARVLPSGTLRDGLGAIPDGGAGKTSGRVDGGVDTDPVADAGGSELRGVGEEATARRRTCLIKCLRALSAVCRLPHAREELARLSRGQVNGTAQVLALLCEALCARVTELRRRQQGPLRRSNVPGQDNADRVRRDLLFVMRCFVPLAQIVANSAPAAAAWHDLVNSKTLMGTGLPCHPWVGYTEKDGGLAVRASSAAGGTQILGNEERTASNRKDTDEAILGSLLEAADRDEWSAMLVGAGLVRSLVSALQACLDSRVAAHRLELMAPGPLPGTRTGNETDVETAYSGCVGCLFEVAQVEVVLALGALLSAHPLASSDRFELAGGALRFRQLANQSTTNRDEVHGCMTRRDSRPGSAATVALPFLHEHCLLVALQVWRLCVRAGGSAAIRPDVVEGAARLVGDLSPTMRSVWERHCAGATATEGIPGPQPVDLRPPDGDQGDPRGSQEQVGGNVDYRALRLGESRRGARPRQLLPLRCPKEVAVPSFGPAAGGAVCGVKEVEASAETGSCSKQSFYCATEALSSLEIPSYLLCGHREDWGTSPSSSTTQAAGWPEDGLQALARDRGSAAATLAASIHSRLVSLLDVADILQVAHNGYVTCLSPSPPENGHEGCGDGGGSAVNTSEEHRPQCLRSPGCPILVLVGFSDGVIDVIGDCNALGRGKAGTAGASGTIGEEMAAPMGDSVGAHEAVLRSALKSFTELVAGRAVMSGAISQENETSTSRGDDRGVSPEWCTRDRKYVRSGDSVAGHGDKFIASPARDGRNTATDAFRQLISLQFFLQAVRRWPRLAVSLMAEVGVWGAIFSELFMSGGSISITRAMAASGESLADVDTAAVSTAPGFGGSDDRTVGSSRAHGDAVGWGLVHDASLLLLEAVVSVRCFLQVGVAAIDEGPVSAQRQEQRLKHGEPSGVASDNPLEIQEYLQFLAGSDSTQPPAATAIQGCWWLRAMVAAEDAVGIGAFLPSSLREAALCFAFKLCDRPNGRGLDQVLPGNVSWSLLHAALSLAFDLVNADNGDERGLLFQAAVAFAMDADSESALAKPRVHHLTASMTSDASTPGHLQATGSWWATGSGGSRTPASPNGLSPHTCPSFFPDASAPPPQPPRPLPEILFKTALDPRARGAAFHFATTLGVSMARVALAAQNGVLGSATNGSPKCFNAGESWALLETAAEIISGLVEGYLCLCERAAAAILTDSAATGDGPHLLLDALRGACALMSADSQPRTAMMGQTDSNGGDGKGRGRDSTRPASVRGTVTDAGVSSLLQEAFREHWASARLLVVLDNLVSGPATSGSVLTPPSMTMESCSDVVKNSLSFFTALMAGNSLGKTAFRQALSKHSSGKAVPSVASTVPSRSDSAVDTGRWVDAGSFAALADIASVVPAATLSEALMEMLMDGEVPSLVLEEGKAADIPEAATGQGSYGGEQHGVASEYQGVTSAPPEIRNPLVVPLVFRLLPDWPPAEQARTLKAFRYLLRGNGGGMINRSVCCDIQPALMDQLLDMLPRLDGGGSGGDDGLRGLVIDVVRHLGSHSITVAQLKKVFRLMQPIPASTEDRGDSSARGVGRRRRSSIGAKHLARSAAAPATPLQPPWLCCLLRALRGMMDDQPGPKRFFLLDGVTSGLRLPRMPRWPAQSGYTFCTWVRLEAGPVIPSVGSRDGGRHRTTPVAAGAPCLFSFCGERGQGVAACFIPLRKRRRPECSPSSSSETPQQYALELRVGAGRKRPPTVVRFPGAVATAGEWTFVAVSHAPRSWGQRGEAAVLLDKCWCSVASPFPRFGDEAVAAASVGRHCPPKAQVARVRATDVEGAGAKIAGRPVLCSLPGQMGPVYLFAGCIPEILLRGIRQLGPDYAFSFEPPKVDSREVSPLPTRDPHLQALTELDDDSAGGGTSDPRAASGSADALETEPSNLHLAALSGALTPHVILAYNPSVWGGEYFLDNTPEYNPVRWTSSQQSSSRARTEADASVGARNRVIYSMAGSQAHVLIQPQNAGHPRRDGISGGRSSRNAGKRALGHRTALPARARGWSGWSGLSSEDNAFGGDGVEGAPTVRPRPRPGYMHAMRLPGTRECVRRDVRDALDCLGGVKVLLPLFAQYDHGVRCGDGRVSYRTDLRLNETVLALLAGTLRDSVPNRRFLRRHGGLSLVQHCLERVSPQHMTPGALVQACRLTDRLGSWSKEWADSGIVSLLAPSRLWVFAPPEAQLTLAAVLRGLAQRCPDRMRDVVGVQLCLDALNLYYWYTPPPGEGMNENVDDEVPNTLNPGEDATGSKSGARGSRGASVDGRGWSYVSRQWVHPSTGQVLGLKASGPVLQEIRTRLLDAVIFMACDGDGVGKADVSAVLGFLRGCRDDASRCEALRLVLRLTDDPHQAGRFTVASGYVANNGYRGDGTSEGDGDYSSGRGPSTGGAAIALFLSLLRASDPTVRLLAFLALAQVMIACLRIDDRSNRGDTPVKRGPNRQSSTDGDDSKDGVTTTAPTVASATHSETANTAVVEFMGGADAKAEELVVLIGASTSQEGWQPRSSERGGAKNGGSDGGSADLLKLQGSAWEHVGLPRHRVVDVLLWAQKQVTWTNGRSAGTESSGSSPEAVRREGDRRQHSGGSSATDRRPEEEAVTGRTVARVTMGVLQGLLVGELPQGFAASVVNCPGVEEHSRDPSMNATAPIVAPPSDVSLDAFFLDSPGGSVSNRERVRRVGSGSRGAGAPPRHPRSHSRSRRHGRTRSRSSSTTTWVTLPLLIRLPEAFPALCQQVATAPQGAVPRGAVIKTLVAAAQSHGNAKSILSVDSWQQYLLSVVSSAQGRQTVAATAESAAAAGPESDGPSASVKDSAETAWPSAAEKSEAGDAGWHGRRKAGDEAAEEERLVDQTVRLICWLAMYEAREGRPGRPGAGFAALQDTMSFLRCQAELGTMECVSVGESMLRHMVSLLKREMDCLESEINGWARVSHQPSLRPMLGPRGGRHAAAAALACVWPLAALVVEFITIPPVANPPVASAAKAPTPSAAALAIVTAAADADSVSPSEWGEESVIFPSPMQGLLQWLDTGMALQPHAQVPPTPSSPRVRGTFPRMGSARTLPDSSVSAAGRRAWELLDAVVDLVGPTGDTLLWDASYRHGLSVETSVGAVDPVAARVLNWGRRGLDLPGRRDDPRAVGDRGTPGGVRGSDDRDSPAPLFIDAKGKGNPVADAGGVPWMLVRLLLAVFVRGGVAEGYADDGTSKGPRRPLSSSSSSSFGSGGSASSGRRPSGGGTGKGGGGAGAGPPSIALVALQRLIALLNSLESSGYEHFDFEVLNVAARVSAALRTTRLTPVSAWVLGALQLLAKCLAVQGTQIEDLLVAAEERLAARDDAQRMSKASSPSTEPSAEVSPRRARLVFSRQSKPAGWWLWDLLSGGGGGKARRRRATPKVVLHQIAAETPSLASMPSGVLALEIIRRTLGIELPSLNNGQKAAGRRRARGAVAAKVEAAPLTWELLEAAFQPVSEEGAGQEAVGFMTRLDLGSMHGHALQILKRIRALEGRGVEAGIRVPADVLMLAAAVKSTEARRAMVITEAKERATHRRQAQWEAVLKQLATERGPWGRGVKAVNLDSVYWALSPSEDDRGRRLKLARNPHGCKHTIASERTRGVTRPTAPTSKPSLRTRLSGGSGNSYFGGTGGDLEPDAGGQRGLPEEVAWGEGGDFGRPDELQEVRAISAQTSLWRDLCKYQRKSLRAPGTGEGSEEDCIDEIEEKEEEESELVDDSDGGDDSSTDEANGESDDWDGSRRGRRATEGGGSQASTTFSSQADVVRPFCATAGLISLVGHRLMFTRSPEWNFSFAEGGGAAGDKKKDETLPDNYRWALRPAPSSSWSASALRRVLFRPYGGMRFAGLEMWFSSGRAHDDCCAEGTLLLGLPSDSLAASLHEALRRTRPPTLEPFLGRLPVTVVARSKAGTYGASAAGGVGMLTGPGPGSGAGPVAAAAAEAARTPLTQAWLNRRCGVTNFDYLRGLNAAAGRTTADLSRYPVFPWVLSERAWRAEELDLTDERNFRDLAWPMGAQRPEQREALSMRYEEMERGYLEQQKMGGEMAELALPPFHHGSHYSSSAYVLWFLMRLEPFTSLHIHLQDGRFDKADRLFQSLPEAYKSCTRNPGDVKEAIPELYYLPELLVNGNGLDLGCPQSTGKPLGDVELPPWAHGDPWEFVRRHREALESEHVSLRLHGWIDLVFGYRQRPPALNGGQRWAVKSCNVFFHLTYPGAVDLPRIREQDLELYESTMKQIEEFGQAPAQLFWSPHRSRLSLVRAEVVRPLASPVPGANTAPAKEASPPSESESTRDSGARPAHGVVSYPRERVSRGAVLLIFDLPWTERLVTVDSRRAIGYHGWRVLSPETSPPFRLRPDTVEAALQGKDSMHGRVGSGGGGAGAVGGGMRVRRLGVPFAPGGVVSSRVLEPPPCSGRSDYGWCSDVGDDLPTPLVGGLGGSYDRLASMRSLLSFPQSAAPASEPLRFLWPQYAAHVSSPKEPLTGFSKRQHGVGTSLDSMVSGGNVGGGGVEHGGYGRAGGGRHRGAGIGMGLGSHLFAVHSEARLLFSGGHWDSSFRVTNLDTGRLVVSIARHRDVVTSLSLADGGAGCGRLVTASRDTTLMVWKVDPGRESPVSASSLLHVLYGHDSPVTCACASAALDAVVSSGEDGTVVVHTLWSGEYVRSITPGRFSSEVTVSNGNTGKQQQGDQASAPPASLMAKGRLTPLWPSVEWVGLSAAGYIVAYSPLDATLRSYSVNGRSLGSARINDEAGPLRAFAFSEDGTVLLSGGHDRLVTLRWVHSLAVADDGSREGCGEAVLTGASPPLPGVPGAGAGVKRFGSAVRCLALTAGERHLLVGLEDGTLGVLALDAKYLRQRLRSKLDELGI